MLCRFCRVHATGAAIVRSVAIMRTTHCAPSMTKLAVSRIGSIISNVASAAVVMVMIYGYVQQGQALYLALAGLAATNLLVGAITLARSGKGGRK